MHSRHTLSLSSLRRSLRQPIPAVLHAGVTLRCRTLATVSINSIQSIDLQQDHRRRAIPTLQRDDDVINSSRTEMKRDRVGNNNHFFLEIKYYVRSTCVKGSGYVNQHPEATKSPNATSVYLAPGQLPSQSSLSAKPKNATLEMWHPQIVLGLCPLRGFQVAIAVL